MPLKTTYFYNVWYTSVISKDILTCISVDHKASGIPNSSEIVTGSSLQLFICNPDQL